MCLSEYPHIPTAEEAMMDNGVTNPFHPVSPTVQPVSEQLQPADQPKKDAAVPFTLE